MLDWILRLIVGAVIVFLLGGCADIKTADALTILERGGFEGEIQISTGGSPLSAGMKQIFYLGPENASLTANGHVKFDKPVGE